MPIYHYCATKQLSGFKTVSIDGIAKMKNPILSMDDYAKLKKEIADGQDIGGEYGLTICSLTLLQE